MHPPTLLPHLCVRKREWKLLGYVCVCVWPQRHIVFPPLWCAESTPFLNDGCRFCPCCLVVAPSLASVCSMPMSLYSHARVYFLWIDRDTSSWTFIAPLSDVYLRGLTPVTGLYGLPPASHPCCLFCLRFAFFFILLLFFPPPQRCLFTRSKHEQNDNDRTQMRWVCEFTHLGYIDIRKKKKNLIIDHMLCTQIHSC